MLSVRLLFVVIGFIFDFFSLLLISICHASAPHFGSMFWQEHMIRVVPSVTSFSLVSTIGVGASAVELVWQIYFVQEVQQFVPRISEGLGRFLGGLMCCAYDWKCMIIWANRFSILAWRREKCHTFLFHRLSESLNVPLGLRGFYVGWSDLKEMSWLWGCVMDLNGEWDVDFASSFRSACWCHFNQFAVGPSNSWHGPCYCTDCGWLLNQSRRFSDFGAQATALETEGWVVIHEVQRRLHNMRT